MKYTPPIGRIFLKIVIFSMVGLLSAQAEYIKAPHEESITFSTVTQKTHYTLQKTEEIGTEVTKLYKTELKKNETGGVISVKLRSVKSNEEVYEVEIPSLNMIDPSEYPNEEGVSRVAEVISLNNQDLLLSSPSGHVRYYYSKSENKFKRLPLYYVVGAKSYFSYSWAIVTEDLLLTRSFENLDPSTLGGLPYSNKYMVYEISTKKLYSLELPEELLDGVQFLFSYKNRKNAVVEAIPHKPVEDLEEEIEFLESVGSYLLIPKSL